MHSETRTTVTPSGHRLKMILLTQRGDGLVPGILWIHGGGYALGMASMVYVSRGWELARVYGGVVLSPAYRLAGRAPYPAALEDCYAALVYLWEHAAELGVDPRRIVVGGESAGGGLAAAVCLWARDRGGIPIALQLPLYPMLDCEDTASSRDNHGRVWNTRRNHWGWKRYLGALYGSNAVPGYASAARATDYRGLPPCYTFVARGEPFYAETLTYVQRLREAGVEARADVYRSDVHAFDMLTPWTAESRAAKQTLRQVYRSMLWPERGAAMPHDAKQHQ